MKRYTSLVLILLLCLTVSACRKTSDSVKNDDVNRPSGAPTNTTPSEPARLEGSWVVTSLVSDGKEIADRGKARFVFHDKGMYTYVEPYGMKTTGTYKSDPTAKPTSIDLQSDQLLIVPNGGPTKAVQGGIYELTGDTLKICLTIARGASRPTQFTAGPGVDLFTLQRQPTKSVDATRKEVEDNYKELVKLMTDTVNGIAMAKDEKEAKAKAHEYQKKSNDIWKKINALDLPADETKNLDAIYSPQNQKEYTRLETTAGKKYPLAVSIVRFGSSVDPDFKQQDPTK